MSCFPDVAQFFTAQCRIRFSKILSETTGNWFFGNAGVSDPIFSRAFLIFSHIDVPDSPILAQDFQNFYALIPIFVFP
jgi:hypothetical protein